MQERIAERPADEILPNSGTHSMERVYALGLVLDQWGLPYRVVAEQGAPYPDGDARVPEGAAFVTYDNGDIPLDALWRIVDRIAPLPIDGQI